MREVMRTGRGQRLRCLFLRAGYWGYSYRYGSPQFFFVSCAGISLFCLFCNAKGNERTRVEAWRERSLSRSLFNAEEQEREVCPAPFSMRKNEGEKSVPLLFQCGRTMVEARLAPFSMRRTRECPEYFPILFSRVQIAD